MTRLEAADSRKSIIVAGLSVLQPQLQLLLAAVVVEVVVVVVAASHDAVANNADLSDGAFESSITETAVDTSRPTSECRREGSTRT